METAQAKAERRKLRFDAKINKWISVFWRCLLH
jgi:hypothetical protein